MLLYYLRTLEARRKVGKFLEANGVANFVNRLFLTGSILPPKMVFLRLQNTYVLDDIS
jgi:hypothetical protein